MDRGAWVDAWAVDNRRIGNDVSAGNEIKAAPKLLDILDVKGDVVTADAVSCQTEIAKKIREKKADYILAVKENQKTLYENIKDYFEGMEQGEIEEMPEDIWETVTGLEWLEKRDAWQDVKTIVQYRTFRTEKGKETVQTDRYYISSGDFSADEFLKYIRGHWSIENQLHWMLDIPYREDECRLRRRLRSAFRRTCCFSKKLRNHWKAFEMVFFYINYGFIFDTRHAFWITTSAGFTRSNILRNVSWYGMPCGSSRNCRNHSSRSRPSISSNPSPRGVIEHNPMTNRSISLCRRYPYCLLGSPIHPSSSFIRLTASSDSSIVSLLLDSLRVSCHEKVSAVALCLKRIL